MELDRWHGENVSLWRRRWAVPALRIFRRVDSTNDVARDMAEADAPEGTLVVSDEQTRGRGRRGRDWHAPPGSSLSMSMILRPPTAAATRILTLRLGLAAARGLERVIPLRVQLKWPNDLQLDGRKVGGILCEAVAVEDRITHVIAGIGLNIGRPGDGWPAHLAARATSLEEVAAAPVAPPQLAGSVVAEWLAVAADPADSLSSEEQRAFGARDALRGREVTVEGRAAGVAEGVSAAGGLRVRRDDQVGEVMAGTIRTLEPIPGESA